MRTKKLSKSIQLFMKRAFRLIACKFMFSSVVIGFRGVFGVRAKGGYPPSSSVFLRIWGESKDGVALLLPPYNGPLPENLKKKEMKERKKGEMGRKRKFGVT